MHIYSANRVGLTLGAIFGLFAVATLTLVGRLMPVLPWLIVLGTGYLIWGGWLKAKIQSDPTRLGPAAILATGMVFLVAEIFHVLYKPGPVTLLAVETYGGWWLGLAIFLVALGLVDRPLLIKDGKPIWQPFLEWGGGHTAILVQALLLASIEVVSGFQGDLGYASFDLAALIPIATLVSAYLVVAGFIGPRISRRLSVSNDDIRIARTLVLASVTIVVTGSHLLPSNFVIIILGAVLGIGCMMIAMRLGGRKLERIFLVYNTIIGGSGIAAILLLKATGINSLPTLAVQGLMANLGSWIQLLTVVVLAEVFRTRMAVGEIPRWWVQPLIWGPNHDALLASVIWIFGIGVAEVIGAVPLAMVMVKLLPAVIPILIVMVLLIALNPVIKAWWWSGREQEFFLGEGD